MNALSLILTAKKTPLIFPYPSDGGNIFSNANTDGVLLEPLTLERLRAHNKGRQIKLHTKETEVILSIGDLLSLYDNKSFCFDRNEKNAVKFQ